MSDSQKKREWRFYLNDMLEFARKAEIYTEGFDQESFLADGLRYDATLRNLELIGEAATRIPESIRKENAGIPWRQIIAIRNRLIHAYLGIDDDIVWSVIRDDIPRLIEQLERFVDRLR